MKISYIWGHLIKKKKKPWCVPAYIGQEHQVNTFAHNIPGFTSWVKSLQLYRNFNEFFTLLLPALTFFQKLFLSMTPEVKKEERKFYIQV